MYKSFGKRIIDFTIALLLCTVLLPLYIIVGVLIKMDSKGPIIFKHKRLGKDCKPIYVWKFRTMVSNAESIGPQFTSANDSRITKLGHFLRNSSIDELPQIVNILKGEMSLIGPRPDAWTDTPSDIQKARAKVLQGITGLAQVNGRSNLTFEERSFYDLEYVRTLSFMTDVKIIVKTVKIVLLKEGTN